MDLAFILNLMYGHLFSKGVDSAMAVSERHINEKEFTDILNRFDWRFIEDNDAEITLCGCDMQLVSGKRSRLIHLAKYYINQDNTDISRNLKKDFIKTACGEIFDHTDWEKERSSEVVEKYLGFFYDLVFMKETSKIPVVYRAVLNSYADTQYDINQDHARRITDLETITRGPQSSGLTPVDFGPYYEEVERRLTAKKRGEYRNLVGEESDETSYIDAFITKGNEQIPVLPFLEEWFEKTEPGVILIHGEPGHGKTLLCSKASFEFYKGRFLKEKAENVVAVSLNTGKNPWIVNDGRLKLSNALVFQVKADDEKPFSFKDCRASLLFLDGFDEFIDKAKEANIDNICSFMEITDGFADKYGIHIVILSRTIAVIKDIEDLDRNYKHYRLSPLSDKQQDRWLDQHDEYDDYRNNFNKLRNNEDMQKLLRVPFLFRLIINSRFEAVTSNIVELYDDLFAHLMHKRGIYKKDTIETVKTGLMNLAFAIYCTDTYMAKINWDTRWVFAFYVESGDGERIGFFHRTFYQYYLAKYIYSGIINITDDNVEDFIGTFAERELDETVRQYLALMFKKEDGSKIHFNIEKMIDALVRTEAYLNKTPRITTGDAEKSRILRSTNVYRNTLHIAAAVFCVIRIPFKGILDKMVRAFDSDGIMLYSEEDKSPDLIGADLSRACLFEADLSRACLLEADLSGADLSGTVLSGAGLSRANLSRANLSRADLSGASLREAYLNSAYLLGAYLLGADLLGADLGRANLNRAYLSRANLSRANLSRADLSRADLSEANLRRAVMRRTDLLGANMRRANLSFADLNGADLNGADLSGTKLNFASLSRADLNGANLSRADLNGANLSGANLLGADLSGADLSGADLSGADLSGADLSGADLSGADLSVAMINFKYKEEIDQSIDGYSSVRWVSDERP